MKIEKDKKSLDKLFARRERYELQPYFQREKVWNSSKQQKLIDSILKEWDMPKVYFRVNSEDEEENYDCVDGQQRMTAIYKFFENELPLPKYSGDLAGKYYSDLPLKTRDVFDDYELDIVLLSDATDSEVEELFLRLQLGISLNSAEKLNAFSGNMGNFVKDLSKHDFFTNKIPLSKKRFALQQICAQICALEIEGVKTLKFKDLEEFYKKNREFDSESKVARKINKVLDEINLIFPTKSSSFRNRASVISFYLLISEMIGNRFRPNQNAKDKLKNFFVDFQQDLKLEVERGPKAKDVELVSYQSSINQAADTKEAISKRHKILKKRLLSSIPEFQEYLNGYDGSSTKKEVQDQVNTLQEEIVKKITQINKSFSITNKTDLFKITNDTLDSAGNLKKIADTKKKFSTLIDSLYKSIYESSGDLSRIPEEFLKEDSIFFDIKHLRTDFFHDIDHGKHSKIQKKKVQISSIYKRYSGKKTIDEIPEENLLVFQITLLERLSSSLDEIKLAL